MSKARIVKDKEFYMLLLTIALPVAMQNFINFLIQMLDTIMLGQLGDVAISASSLANQPFFVFTMITFGIAGGASVLTAQYWGKGEIKPIRSIITIVLRISFALGILLGVTILIFPEQVMRIYTNDPQVIAEGVGYLKYMGYSYFFFSISNTFFSVVRSVQIVGVAVISNVIALICNASLNYVFIFGKFGVPAMGVQGAALATLITRIVECAIAVTFALLIDKKIKLRIRHFFRFDKVLFADISKYSAPVILNEIMWSLGISLQSVILGRLGTNVVAANTIVGVVQNLATVAVFGVASAAAVIVGKAIGEGDLKKARDRGFTLKLISLVLGVIVTVSILLIKDFAIDFYNVSSETKEIAHQLIYVLAFVGFLISIAAISVVGILRGGGDTKFSLWAEAISLWGVAVPMAFLAAFVFKWPVPIVFICMKLDEPVKVLMCLSRLKGTNWIKIVTRDNIQIDD